MPKYKSEMIRKEVKNADGSTQTVGQVAWVPLNDAAKAHERAKEAMELGAYKPNDPNEVENMKKTLFERQRQDIVRRGSNR